MEKETLKQRIKPRKEEFTPLKDLDLSQCTNFNDLVKGMSLTAFGGRKLGEAVDVAELMIRDNDCVKILTLSGAMTIAKMNLVICEMIENKMVDLIISTGALIAHGFIGSMGIHFKNPNKYNDEQLFKMGYDRVYDSLESESNFYNAAEILYRIFDSLAQEQYVCSNLILKKLGKYLNENIEGRNVIKSAYNRKIPIFIPAFTDSELGMEFYINNKKRESRGDKSIHYDPFIDLEHYAKIVLNSKKLGIFTIGGGVPRNWAQQIGPILQWLYIRADDELKNMNEQNYLKRFTYGVRICPEPVHWGGLSGCTYSEGVSWGKFVPETEGGKYAEVLCDATIAWPIIVKALLERLNL